jgi:serine/threonine protein kinase
LETLNEPDDLIDHSPKLGNGTYGEVKTLKNEEGEDVAVMKITGCIPNLIGYMTSPFRAEQIEPRILNALWNEFVATGITPHIIAPYGTHAIVKSVTSDQLRECVEMDQSLVYFMEKASADTLRHHLGFIDKRDFDLHCKVLIFQVAYTLGAIYSKYPKFRHNDLKDDNVLLHHSRDTGFTKYTIYGQTFYVPCIGVSTMISDFDFACISGSQFDNFKVIEQSWDTPTYNINARENHFADFFLLIHYIRLGFTSRMSKALREQLDEIYGTFRKGYNLYHLHPADGAPSVEELLCESGLFDDFWVDSVVGVVHETYAVPTKHVASAPTLVTCGRGDVRHCPIFRPRNVHVSTLVNPSMCFFNKLVAHKEARESEQSDIYSAPVAIRLLNCVRIAYAHKGDEENDIPVHDLPPEDMEDCMRAIGIIARNFIESYHVPYRWWAAVFTCAFVDACYDMAIVPEGQRCWKIEDWCAFWQHDCAEAIYSPIQMLHFALEWEWLRR